MILKEWKCSKHGHFEGSHPICPKLGCTSKNVKQVILTAPGFRSSKTKQTDNGIKDVVDSMNLGNIRSAREGEPSYGGHRASEMLWGNDVQKVLGQPLAQVVDEAARPFTVKKQDGKNETVPHGMRLAATEVGITQKVLPSAQVRISKSEESMKRKLNANP